VTTSKTRSPILVGLMALGAIALATCVAPAAEPPHYTPTPDDTHFYAASQPTYLSVDGQTVVSFNALMNIMSVTTAGTAGPTTDVDEKCRQGNHPCVTVQGLTMAEPPHMGDAYAPHWSVNGAEFRIVGCARQYQGKCFTHLISTIGRDGAQGWYAYSDKRGVEFFGRKAAGGGYENVYILTADTGLLKADAR
jgi:hypothetical protein